MFALIVALAVLHNIAMSRNDPDFEPEGTDGFGDEDDDNDPVDVDDNHNTTFCYAVAVRRRIIHGMFLELYCNISPQIQETKYCC
jgi:hypothetical protein